MSAAWLPKEKRRRDEKSMLMECRSTTSAGDTVRWGGGTQKKLGKTLRVTQPAIFNRAKEMGMIRKEGNWVLPDIAPSDYYLFRSMQLGLADQHFSNYDEVKKWIDEWIVAKEPAFFRDRIRQLPERWEKNRPDGTQDPATPLDGPLVTVAQQEESHSP
ncbi:hypothetical protein LAZ67_X000348 [Cordylochernes scorpioides]|uniref:Mariner Mos1 transposase n=1 Tax=Cordylochernes scorpioides TaxID=51811 RepID=A0ABY6LRI6_9ARAC|nr:hypothetical protein LAZ67_X000348 [Cordylochernes scorpioides]